MSQEIALYELELCRLLESMHHAVDGLIERQDSSFSGAKLHRKPYHGASLTYLGIGPKKTRKRDEL